MDTSSRTLLVGHPGSSPDDLRAAVDRLRAWRGATPGDAGAAWLTVAGTGAAPLGWRVDAGPHEARLTTDAEVTSLYLARGSAVTAVSTHAVDAALAAHGRAVIDPVSAGAVTILGFSPGTGNLLEGVTALPPGAAVHLAPAAVTWTAPAALTPISTADAAERARAALTDRVERAARAGATLCLTGGLDSRVLAAIVARAGTSMPTLTWGGSDDHDVLAAATVAAHLGLPHRTVPLVTARPEEIDGWLARELRVSEGVRPPHPPGAVVGLDAVGPLLTGAGGETGRAFYSRWAMEARPRPRSSHLVDAILAAPAARAVAPEILAAVRDRVGAALAIGQERGFAGWHASDHFYATERLAHWGRAMLPDVPAPVTGAFLGTAVQTALLSLDLAVKRRDGFHRDLLAALLPEMVPPVAYARRRGVPAPLRRAVARLRRPAPAGWPLHALLRDDAETARRIVAVCHGSTVAADVLGPDRDDVEQRWVQGGDAAAAMFGLSGVLELELALAATARTVSG